jgi:hypothetical protein
VRHGPSCAWSVSRAALMTSDAAAQTTLAPLGADTGAGPPTLHVEAACGGKRPGTQRAPGAWRCFGFKGFQSVRWVPVVSRSAVVKLYPACPRLAWPVEGHVHRLGGGHQDGPKRDGMRVGFRSSAAAAADRFIKGTLDEHKGRKPRASMVKTQF